MSVDTYLTRRLRDPSDRRHITGYPPICLEQGKKYKIRLEFQPFTTQEPGRNIGTLIDSVSCARSTEDSEETCG